MSIQPNKLFINLLLLVTICFSSVTHSAIQSIQQQRDLFIQAEQALKSKQHKQYKNLSKQLKDYPISAYLKFDEISKRLSAYSHKEVVTFLETYKDYPFTYRLRGRWLKYMAQTKQWKKFLSVYDNRSNAKLKCLSFQAKIKLKRNLNDQFLKDISKVWMSGYSQPKQCDIPFKYLLTKYSDPSKLIWKRIEKAFKAGKSSLARHLAKKLSKQDQAIVNVWYQSHRRPEKQLKKLRKAKNTVTNRKIIVHALNRLARKDALKAHKQWLVIADKFPFNQQQKDNVVRKIALSAAYQHLGQAKTWLSKLPESVKTDKTDIWLARINIRDQDWRGLISSINNMPTHLQQNNEWQYWMARSFSEMGFSAKANSQYKTLAKQGSYYGFLAADKVGAAYVIDNESVAKKIDEKQLLKENVHLLRARELYYVKRTLDARREWYKGVKNLKVAQIKQVAKLASKWQWHDNAIKTVAKTPHRQDYDLRFPLPYKSLVMKNAKAKNLDPSVIYGVMRRESLFDPKAGSPVGALGLMQLMPNTAKQVAKSLGLKRPRKSDILNVKNNINFGTQYFKKVLSKFDNNTALAAAAYNAGPHRVKKWLPDNTSMNADLWVETIPYKETRNYVQAVLAYSTIFDKALGKEIKMSSRMHDIKVKY